MGGGKPIEHPERVRRAAAPAEAAVTRGDRLGTPASADGRR
ncbi:hypothetical protein [Bailinhaonella thermotolerans]|nr:hypothetical protein [Bailinhaonella thermotolerans]